jgi:hypothetical protein
VKTQLEERERLLEESKENLAAAAVELGKERNALAVSVRACLPLISKLTGGTGFKTRIAGRETCLEVATNVG